MIVPGGGLSPDGTRWVSSKPAFLLPVRVLGALFRRLFLAGLARLHKAGKLRFFGEGAGLSDRRTFARHLAPVRRKRWVVYAKSPFAGPKAVPAYLGRYTHRVAISNSRLIGMDESGVTFRCKDYRRDGAERYGTMTLAPAEFIRRFLLHVLPRGFHRIRHYGFLAASARRSTLSRARELLAVSPPDPAKPIDTPGPAPCPCCGGQMRLVEVFARATLAKEHRAREASARWRQPRGPPHPPGQAGENNA